MSSGELVAFKYCSTPLNRLNNDDWINTLQHHLVGRTHHVGDDFQALFTPSDSAVKIQPVGNLQPYKSETDFEYVFVHRVGKRRKYVDDINNVFVKAFNKLWKFPEAIEY